MQSHFSLNHPQSLSQKSEDLPHLNVEELSTYYPNQAAPCDQQAFDEPSTTHTLNPESTNCSGWATPSGFRPFDSSKKSAKLLMAPEKHADKQQQIRHSQLSLVLSQQFGGDDS